jgi:hypothetical protein
MTDDFDPIQDQVCRLIEHELDTLGPTGLAAHLDHGRAFELAPVLEAGGVLVFPHINPRDCAYQVAACVHACLDLAPRPVVVLSVLHEASATMQAARARVRDGAPLDTEPLRGIHGPGCGRSEIWRNDHALITWRRLLATEAQRRRIEVSPVLERYPFLVAGDPASLPGIDQLRHEAADAVLVATLDPIHHGVVYGTPADAITEPDESGMAMAGTAVRRGLAALARGEYDEYDEYEAHCAEVISDGADVGEVFHHLRHPLTGRALDLTVSDSSQLGGAPHPTWVAGALVEWSSDRRQVGASKTGEAIRPERRPG